MAERPVLACLLLHVAFIYLWLSVISTSQSLHFEHFAFVCKLFVFHCLSMIEMSIDVVILLDLCLWSGC